MIVKRPLLLTLIPPKAEAVPPSMALFSVKAPPVNEMAVADAVSLPVVVIVPLNIVLTLPALCINEVALISSLATTLAALDIVKIFKG